MCTRKENHLCCIHLKICCFCASESSCSHSLFLFGMERRKRPGCAMPMMELWRLTSPWWYALCSETYPLSWATCKKTNWLKNSEPGFFQIHLQKNPRFDPTKNHLASTHVQRKKYGLWNDQISFRDWMSFLRDFDLLPKNPCFSLYASWKISLFTENIT